MKALIALFAAVWILHSTTSAFAAGPDISVMLFAPRPGDKEANKEAFDRALAAQLQSQAAPPPQQVVPSAGKDPAGSVSKPEGLQQPLPKARRREGD